MNGVQNDIKTSDMILENIQSHGRRKLKEINKETKMQAIALGILALVAMAGILAWGSISHDYQLIAAASITTAVSYFLILGAMRIGSLLGMHEGMNAENYENQVEEIPLAEPKKK